MPSDSISKVNSMKLFSLLALVLTLGLTMAVGEADAAKRLGGGKSTGMQRQMGTPDKSPAATAAPAQTANAKAPAAGATAAAQPKSSWMGPLAGLAAGIGLAALASHFGFGEELASMLMIGLLVMAVMLVIGLIMRRRAAGAQPAMAGASADGGTLKYAGSGAPNAPLMRTHEVLMPSSAAGTREMTSVGTPSGHIPAEFDVPAFERNSKINFIRLQAANDARNLDDIRDFTTPEMFAELKMNIDERGNATQNTDVININAQVLDVAEEAARYVVSVRFTGLVSEGPGIPSESVDEIWHLVKSREDNNGWLLAGIQLGNS